MRPLVIHQIARVSRSSRLYFARFSFVHIDGLLSNQTASLKSPAIHQFKKFWDGHLASKRYKPSFKILADI